jgi:hypothetical protein
MLFPVAVPKKESTKPARDGPRAELLPIDGAATPDAVCANSPLLFSGDISGEESSCGVFDALMF